MAEQAPHQAFTAGHTALVTGGASGIGLAFARLCHAQHGMKIALVDIDASALESAKKSLLTSSSSSHAQPPVHTYILDVSQLEQWQDLRPRVEMDMGLISILMLNAGMGRACSWDDASSFHNTIQTNYMGVVNGISTFLPSLRAQGDAPTAVIITGSKQGITNPPGNPAYNASKAAVKSVAESLAYDLRGTSTSVHLLVPGWTFTGMTKRAGKVEKPEGAWWPEQVAEFLEKTMAQGKFYAICPDNDVTEEMDRKRMWWSTGDAVLNRPPLSRWREGWKDDAKRWMDQDQHISM